MVQWLMCVWRNLMAENSSRETCTILSSRSIWPPHNRHGQACGGRSTILFHPFTSRSDIPSIAESEFHSLPIVRILITCQADHRSPGSDNEVGFLDTNKLEPRLYNLQEGLRNLHRGTALAFSFATFSLYLALPMPSSVASNWGHPGCDPSSSWGLKLRSSLTTPSLVFGAPPVFFATGAPGSGAAREGAAAPRLSEAAGRMGCLPFAFADSEV